jgi:hypothetical protein
VALLAGAAHAQAPIDVSTHRVVCNSILKGVAQFAPALTNTGALPGVTKIKGALGGCADLDDPTIQFLDGKSSFSGSISGAPNNCAGLAGPSIAAGTITFKWKTVQKLVSAVSTVTIASGSTVGSAFGAPWGGLYGNFGLGAAYGGAALAVTGAFAGSDGGATSSATAITSQDVAMILTQCAAAGVKLVNLGAGQISLQ